MSKEFIIMLNILKKLIKLIILIHNKQYIPFNMFYRKIAKIDCIIY